MMKRSCRPVAMILAGIALFSLAACQGRAQNVSSPAASPAPVSSSAVSPTPTPPPAASSAAAEQPQAVEARPLSSSDFTELPSLFPEGIDQVLVVSGTIFARSEQALWKVENHERQKVLDLIPNICVDRFQLQKTSTGYLALFVATDESDPLGNLMPEASDTYAFCKVLDDAFHETEQIDFDVLAEQNKLTTNPLFLAVSPDNQQLACVYGGLAQPAAVLFYNLETQNTVIVSAANDTSGINVTSIEACRFAADSAGLAFAGQGLRAEGLSFPIYGKVLQNGSTEIYCPTEISGDLLFSSRAKFNVSSIFLPEDDRYKDGRCLQIDLSTMTEHALSLTDASEGNLIYPSEDGQYLCTIGSFSPMGPYTLCVYDMANNQNCVLSQSVSQPNGARVLLLSDQRICVLVNGSGDGSNPSVSAWDF